MEKKGEIITCVRCVILLSFLFVYILHILSYVPSIANPKLNTRFEQKWIGFDCNCTICFHL